MPASKKDAGGTCRACGVRAANRPRVLCASCYARPKVRARHPPRSPRLGESIKAPVRPLPAGPTDCLPGTEGKIEAMRQRDARGEQLYHPGDARFEDAVPAECLAPAEPQEEDDCLPQRLRGR